MAGAIQPDEAIVSSVPAAIARSAAPGVNAAPRRVACRIAGNIANGRPNISVSVLIHALHPTYGRYGPQYKIRSVAVRRPGAVCRSIASHVPRAPTTTTNATAAATR